MGEVATCNTRWKFRWSKNDTDFWVLVQESIMDRVQVKVALDSLTMT